MVRKSAFLSFSSDSFGNPQDEPIAIENFGQLPKAFNNTVAKLGQIIGNMRDSAQRVDTGSDEIRAASDDLAARNEQQAASLEETASSMREVTQLVKKSA